MLTIVFLKAIEDYPLETWKACLNGTGVSIEEVNCMVEFINKH